jgi:diacylglycerol O-acyltransferase / wax synthase
VNLVVSNVPGPPVPLYLAGARLLEVFPTLPPMGNLTLVVAALSYAGQLNLTAAADQDSCPDVQVFADGVRRAVDDLARSAIVSATTDSDGEQRQLEQPMDAAPNRGGRR